MNICNVDCCNKPKHGLLYCDNHYRLWKKYGDPLARVKRPSGEGCRHDSGYWIFGSNGKGILRHVLIAEKALGHQLPYGAQVHHVDEDKSNDVNSNLVICPSSSYHQLLHKRMRALVATGNANSEKCWICQCYGDPSSMADERRRFVHYDCRRKYARNLYAEKRKSA